MIKEEAFADAILIRLAYAKAIAKGYAQFTQDEQEREKIALSTKYFTLLNGFRPIDIETPQLRVAMKEHALVAFTLEVIKRSKEFLNEEALAEGLSEGNDHIPS